MHSANMIDCSPPDGVNQRAFVTIATGRLPIDDFARALPDSLRRVARLRWSTPRLVSQMQVCLAELEWQRHAAQRRLSAGPLLFRVRCYVRRRGAERLADLIRTGCDDSCSTALCRVLYVATSGAYGLPFMASSAQFATMALVVGADSAASCCCRSAPVGIYRDLGFLEIVFMCFARSLQSSLFWLESQTSSSTCEIAGTGLLGGCPMELE